MTIRDNHSAPDLDRLHTAQDTILIIHDDSGTRLNLARMCRRIGFQALTAGDSSVGISVFEQYAPYIACVLLALHMPELSGAETLAQLRVIRPEAPVLIVKSAADSLGPVLGHTRIFVLAKPLTVEQLQVAVRRALDL
jgi:DNA-binding response OmpR family regulator